MVLPLDGIPEIAHRYGALLIIDCVTSLGGVPVRVDERGIDIAYSGTQKCLSCPPGLAPLTINEKAMDVLNHRKIPVANWYLDLTVLSQYWGSERTYHHTAPISMNYALREALRLVFEEGLPARFERHIRNAQLFWEGLEELGLEPLVPIEHRLPTLTTIRVPEGVDEAAVRKQLLEEPTLKLPGAWGYSREKFGE